MPNVTHRKAAHRYVLTYTSDEDLNALCEAIIGLAERPDLDFEIADALALAVAVADQMVREELRRSVAELCRPNLRPALDRSGRAPT